MGSENIKMAIGHSYTRPTIVNAAKEEIKELEKIAKEHNEVLLIATDYATGKLDSQQAIIKIADVLDAWVE